MPFRGSCFPGSAHLYAQHPGVETQQIHRAYCCGYSVHGCGIGDIALKRLGHAQVGSERGERLLIDVEQVKQAAASR